ncbi:hypothetical protein [Nocardia amamiensis]|uniref:hypothetical protein n=1 Tax=Nocardia amamiensis TaxID=404578 RepID=UPI0033E5CB14
MYNEAEAVLTEMRSHLDPARAAQAGAEGERGTAVANANTVIEEDGELRAQLDNERAEHRQDIERRDSGRSGSSAVTHSSADNSATIALCASKSHRR